MTPPSPDGSRNRSGSAPAVDFNRMETNPISSPPIPLNERAPFDVTRAIPWVGEYAFFTKIVPNNRLVHHIKVSAIDKGCLTESIVGVPFEYTLSQVNSTIDYIAESDALQWDAFNNMEIQTILS